MATHPTRPGTKPAIDDETRRILEERLLTIDADVGLVEAAALHLSGVA